MDSFQYKVALANPYEVCVMTEALKDEVKKVDLESEEKIVHTKIVLLLLIVAISVVTLVKIIIIGEEVNKINAFIDDGRLLLRGSADEMEHYNSEKAFELEDFIH